MIVFDVNGQTVRVQGQWYPGGRGLQILAAMLNGESLTTIESILQFNLPTINARCAELRRMGWPVRRKDVPHPRLPGEVMLAYYFDAHFRAWFMDHIQEWPGNYKGGDGRGKFGDYDGTCKETD